MTRVELYATLSNQLSFGERTYDRYIDTDLPLLSVHTNGDLIVGARAIPKDKMPEVIQWLLDNYVNDVENKETA